MTGTPALDELDRIDRHHEAPVHEVTVHVNEHPVRLRVRLSRALRSRNKRSPKASQSSSTSSSSTS